MVHFHYGHAAMTFDREPPAEWSDMNLNQNDVHQSPINFTHMGLRQVPKWNGVPVNGNMDYLRSFGGLIFTHIAVLWWFDFDPYLFSVILTRICFFCWGGGKGEGLSESDRNRARSRASPRHPAPAPVAARRGAPTATSPPRRSRGRRPRCAARARPVEPR